MCSSPPAPGIFGRVSIIAIEHNGIIVTYRMSSHYDTQNFRRLDQAVVSPSPDTKPICLVFIPRSIHFVPMSAQSVFSILSFTRFCFRIDPPTFVMDRCLILHSTPLSDVLPFFSSLHPLRCFLFLFIYQNLTSKNIPFLTSLCGENRSVYQQVSMIPLVAS